MSPRDLFEVPGPGPYLFSHSVGCLPRATRARIEHDLLQPWAEEGSHGWDAWLAAIEAFRVAVARLLGGDVAEVCPQPSVSTALSNILSGLPREPGRDVLLVSAHAFASIGFAMRQLAPLGYRLEILPEEHSPIDPHTWADALGPHVAAIVPMHVHSNSGLASPTAEIAALARAAGAVTVVDACQSVGVLAVDPHSWGVDALIGSCVKWLSGGPGAGFLWVRRDLIGTLEPVQAGWFSHAEPFKFDIRDFRYADDARRFWGGTPAPGPCAIAASGIETVLGIGQPAVLAHNRRLIGVAAEAADTAFDMRDRGGTLCLVGDVEAAEGALRTIGARFDRRSDILRLSFSIWNDEEQAAQIGRILGEHRLTLV